MSQEILKLHSTYTKVKQNNNKELYEMAKYSGKDNDYLINQKCSTHFIKR